MDDEPADVAVPDRGPLVLEMTRLLKPGGRLALREPSRPGHGMPPAEIRDLARNAGLRHLALDLHWGLARAQARRISFAVLGLTAFVTVVAAWRLFV